MRPALAPVFALLMGLPAAAQGDREPRIPPGVEVERDIEYGTGGGRPLLLDLYRPTDAPKGKLPCVIFFHGGGWRGGDKKGTPVARLVPRGYVAVSVNYRLSGEATFPAAVEDAKCAVRWVRAHAEQRGIDADRLGAWGSSAGGHLALMVGLAGPDAKLEGEGGNADASSRVQAVVSWFGPADFASGHEHFEGGPGAEQAFLGGAYEEKKDVWVRASPVTHASKDDPPVLMIHGARDDTVPLDQSKRMLAALEEAGGEARLIVVKGAGHGFKPAGRGGIDPSREEIDEATFSFFDEHLKR